MPFLTFALCLASVKLPTFLLACLLLAAALNVGLAARRHFQLGTLPPALAVTHPADAFAARLDAVSDPAELRRLALARHRALLAADHDTRALLGTVETISRADFIQSGIVLLCALGVWFYGHRTPRPAALPTHE